MRRQRSFSVQSKSGLNFQIPRLSSNSTGCASARVGDCSRRMPVIQASTPPSARSSAATLRSPQQCAGPGPVAGRVLDLDVDAEALLERPPGRERLREQHAGVDRDDAGVGREPHQLVDEHRLLLLEGAEHDQARVVALHRLRQHLGDASSRDRFFDRASARCVHHSGSVRPAKSRNVSPSSWLCS